MSILLHYILVAQTGSMLYCLIPVQCRSDSASFSLLPQPVCYLVWSLDSIHLTLPRHRRSHRKYVILLNTWTMLIWLRHILSAPTARMSSCLIPGQCWFWLCRILCSHSLYVILFDPRPMTISLCLVVAIPTGSMLLLFTTLTMSIWLYLVFTALIGIGSMWSRLILLNVDLTLPCSHCSCRLYVIFLEPFHNTDVPRCRRTHRPYVILFDPLTMLIWVRRRLRPLLQGVCDLV